MAKRILSAVRQVDLLPIDQKQAAAAGLTGKLPAEQSFLRAEGEVVITAVQREGDDLLVRLFNPSDKPAKATLSRLDKLTAARSVTLDGRDETATTATVSGGAVKLSVPPKRIATLLVR